MNHGLTLIVSFSSFVQTSSREFGEVGLGTYTWGIKGFHKNWSGSLAKRRVCLGPRPVFVKTVYTLSVHAQTHLLKFSETSLNKGKERYNQS